MNVSSEMQINKTKEVKSSKKEVTLIIFFAIFTVMLFIVSLAVGRYHVPVFETIKIMLSKIIPITPTWDNKMENIIINIRLPRLCGAALVGAALTLSGTTYQGMFKNPLVSPDLLGVSAGACVGASAAILLHLGTFEVQLFALLFGLLAVVIATAIPKLFKNKTSLMLVLSGVIVSGFMGAIQGVFKYIADPEDELASIVYWTMGSLSSVSAHDVLTVGPAIIAAIIALFLIRWRINLLSLGDNEAKSLGINVKKLRGFSILCSTILTACAVCISGTIGWIGLIIPHLGRIIIGQDNKHLIPISIFLGASFMIVVDTLARNLTEAEIPLSILTGLIGAPLFVWLLSRQKARID